MTIREWVSPFISRRKLDPSRHIAARTRAEATRKAAGARHTVFYFHQSDDAYSVLTAQVLGALAQRYDIDIKAMVASPPRDDAAPERDALLALARRDACALAERFSLSFSDPGHQPSADLLEQANRILTSAQARGQFEACVCAVDTVLWAEDAQMLDRLAHEFGISSARETEAVLVSGAERRHEMGHYLGATFCYAGEQYWGIDRLYHLEQRLFDLGACREEGPFSPLAPRPVLGAPTSPIKQGAEIDFYMSLRSPYTHVAAPQLFALAKRYNATVNIKFVLPMMMRGVPASAAKQQYILIDTQREAAQAGVPFGPVADPFGSPAERGLSLIPYAVSQGKGEEYVLSFLKAVWAQGIRSGSNRGLKQIVTRAGLEWDGVQQYLRHEGGRWRDEAERNRVALYELGLWGVPSFQVGSVVAWGQDRLWLVEQELAKLAEQ
ncbi:MAG: DsbA family protein [Parvibaculaceae bacterium]|nr:DsbA family protein [Parvibaculaceae bacterium]